MTCYKVLGNLLYWIFPTKEDKRNFRYFCREIDERGKIAEIHKRYLATLERLKLKYKKEKIKIVFLNDTVAKWQYQPLYDELKNNPDFELQVLITVQDYHTEKKMSKILDYEAEAKKGYEFFAAQGMNVDYAFDFEKKAPINLKQFNADIIFYEQPWALFNPHKIEETSNFALTCYSSYGSCLTAGKNEYSSIFFKTVFKYFIDNDYSRNLLLLHHAPEEAIVVSGHPKLDQYKLPCDKGKSLWKNAEKKHIIYAPHFSFYNGTDLHFGTFDKNGEFLLEYAKSHPEIEFIFKPHPRLREDIIRRGLMSEAECEEYYNNWATLPNAQLVENGNYIEIFKNSDGMITDCNSFLLEYLPSEKPILHMISGNSKGFNNYGKKIISGYYPIKTLEELETMISEVILKGNDVLKDKRKQIIANNLYQPQEGYAKFVANHITELLSGEEEAFNCNLKVQNSTKRGD